MAAKQPLYMGFDLSTQQLKAIVVSSDLRLVHEAKVDFDADFGGKYGIVKGVLNNPDEGEVFAPPAMWLDAVNLVLDRLQQAGLDFSRVKGLSGAGMQHGTVFWSHDAENLLSSLNPEKTLAQQLEPGSKGERPGALAHPMSPNWQDASTQPQCELFDRELGDPETLARVTGSKAHHRFSGPQILRYRTKYPTHYDQTARISLVSSFLASIFLGRIAPIDISDVTGMNLWNIKGKCWDERLLGLTAGGPDKTNELRQKLGEVSEDGGASFGSIANYFVVRYGFAADCRITPFTGDNPSTILALPLLPSDAIVSLGTSTTFLMSTPSYVPDPSYHFMNHPTTYGLHMFMLCYKNGGLAREQVRDQLNTITPGAEPNSWTVFNQTALDTPPLAQALESTKTDSAAPSEMRLGLFFPLPEIVPNVPAGQHRYLYQPTTDTLTALPTSATTHPSASDARTILESQFLSLRLRSRNLLTATSSTSSSTPSSAANPPAGMPRRVYLVGGGSANPAVADLAGAVLGAREGVFRLDIGANACALGAAYKACWARERGHGAGGDEARARSFEELVAARWDEDGFVRKVAEGYRPGVWEKYGEALRGFEEMERRVEEEGRKERGG